MKKLKEIVEVLSQIVALKCSAQDGGPGSGQKGHTTARQEQNKIDGNKRQQKYEERIEKSVSGAHPYQHGESGKAYLAAKQSGKAEVDAHLAARESALKTYNSKTASPEEKAQAAKDYYKAKDRAEAAGANNDYASRGPRD
jgi:hypothetical protein